MRIANVRLRHQNKPRPLAESMPIALRELRLRENVLQYQSENLDLPVTNLP